MEEQVVVHTGNHRLYGMLHIPPLAAQEKFPIVVICHGFISSKVGQHRIFVKTARAIVRAGYAVLRFDYSGCGESTGEERNISVSEQIKETQSMLDFLATHPRIDTEQIILLGHSLGGAVAAITAGLDKRVKKLILWSPVAQPLAELVAIVGAERYQECLQGKVTAYQGFELGPLFFSSLAQLHPLELIKSFPGKLLIAHGSGDLETPLENADKYRQACDERLQGAVQLHVVEGADHTYSLPLWEEEVIGLTVRWLLPVTA